MSPVLPPDFLGISVEWRQAVALSHSATVRRLLRYLVQPTPSSNHLKLNIRVGGNSADQTWWNDDGSKDQHESCSFYYSHQNCVNYDLTTNVIHALFKMARSITNTTLLFDLTMVNPDWAVQEWNGFWKAITSSSSDSYNSSILEGIEIGNEPDLFASHGIRPPDYDPQEFIQEYRTYLQRLESSGLHELKRFVRGGTFCCRQAFLQAQVPIMEQFQDYFYSWSFHHYPVTGH